MDVDEEPSQPSSSGRKARAGGWVGAPSSCMLAHANLVAQLSPGTHQTVDPYSACTPVCKDCGRRACCFCVLNKLFQMHRGLSVCLLICVCVRRV